MMYNFISLLNPDFVSKNRVRILLLSLKSLNKILDLRLILVSSLYSGHFSGTLVYGERLFESKLCCLRTRQGYNQDLCILNSIPQFNVLTVSVTILPVRQTFSSEEIVSCTG